MASNNNQQPLQAGGIPSSAGPVPNLPTAAGAGIVPSGTGDIVARLQPVQGGVAAASGGAVTNLQNIKGDGVVLAGNGGVTVLIQDLSQSAIRNMVINTAHDRTIMQNTSVTLAIPNLQDLQQTMSLEHLRSSITEAVNQGLLNSAGR